MSVKMQPSAALTLFPRTAGEASFTRSFTRRSSAVGMNGTKGGRPDDEARPLLKIDVILASMAASVVASTELMVGRVPRAGTRVPVEAFERRIEARAVSIGRRRLIFSHHASDSVAWLFLIRTGLPTESSVACDDDEIVGVSTSSPDNIASDTSNGGGTVKIPTLAGPEVTQALAQQ